MNLLVRNALEFFRRDMLQETNQQIRLFEAQSHSKLTELGRIRLYEERSKITKHFDSCDKNIGVFLTCHPVQALLGRISHGQQSHSLSWMELQSIRHSLEAHLHSDLLWDNPNEPPKVCLTNEGKIEKNKKP